MFLSVDRLEGEFAICTYDEGEEKEIHLDLLPREIAEGDVLFCKNGEYIIDKEQTLARQKDNFDRMNRLMKKD